MTTNTNALSLRDLINRQYAPVAALGAICTLLESKATGTTLDPVLDARIRDLLKALGAGEGDVLANTNAQEALSLFREVRHVLLIEAEAASYNGTPSSRATVGWRHTNPQILQAFGDFARDHASAIMHKIVPALGLTERWNAPDASFLDVGVGVGGLALEIAEQCPSIKVVGIDVWQPSLALARKNIDEATPEVAKRIELREQSIEDLKDDKAFDLVWIPTPFLPGRVIAPGAARSFTSLRPGGWILCPTFNPSDDPTTSAMLQLRRLQWGGSTSVSVDDLQDILKSAGFVDVKRLPVPPGSVAAMIAGRRP